MKMITDISMKKYFYSRESELYPPAHSRQASMPASEGDNSFAFLAQLALSNPPDGKPRLLNCQMGVNLKEEKR